jgi:microcystin-dependent protein
MGTDTYLAEIMPFAGSFAVRGYAMCDGQLLAISQNTALFSLLGTTFGGDGRTTFGLPDLRGRSIVHPGNGPGLDSIRWGQRGGNFTHTMTVSQMANHSHILTGAPTVNVGVTNADGDDSLPGGNLLAKPDASAGTVDLYTAATPNGSLGGVTASAGTLQAENQGGQQAFNIRNPFLGINMEIAMVGIYPSRS